jgi:hypothetical protein
MDRCPVAAVYDRRKRLEIEGRRSTVTHRRYSMSLIATVRRNLNPSDNFAHLIEKVGETTQRTWGQNLGRGLGWMAAWAWTIVAGGGGLGLLITRGPLPLTNGWFALFSGISACPLTAWLLKKYAGITLSGLARFGIALLVIVIGRLVLKIEGRGNFLPGL